MAELARPERLVREDGCSLLDLVRRDGCESAVELRLAGLGGGATFIVS